MELYGLVLSAQVLVGYVGIIVDFGTNSVCARHVSINRDNPRVLSEIVSSVLFIRGIMAVFCFGVYLLIVFLTPSYRENYLLFILSYGILVSGIFFPQYFFQGMEKLKYATYSSIILKSVFVVLIFIFVKSSDDYLLIPVLQTVGSIIGTIPALYIAFGCMHIRLVIPRYSSLALYIKYSSPLLATNLVTSIKVRFNYFFIGNSVGMSEVIIYDLGIKLNSLVSNPTRIMESVMYPRIAKSRKFHQVCRLVFFTFLASGSMCIAVNLLLPWIVDVFLHKEVDMAPIRILSLAPVILSVSGVLGHDFLVAFGYNRYIFYSSIITTLSYLLALIYVYISDSNHSIYAFVYIAIITYLIELIYRLYITRRKTSHESYTD